MYLFEFLQNKWQKKDYFLNKLGNNPFMLYVYIKDIGIDTIVRKIVKKHDIIDKTNNKNG